MYLATRDPSPFCEERRLESARAGSLITETVKKYLDHVRPDNSLRYEHEDLFKQSINAAVRDWFNGRKHLFTPPPARSGHSLERIAWGLEALEWLMQDDVWIETYPDNGRLRGSFTFALACNILDLDSFPQKLRRLLFIIRTEDLGVGKNPGS